MAAYKSAGGGAALSTATPQAVGTAAPGSGTAASKDDHVHAHGNQAASTTMHAAAVAAGTSGFLTGADKTKVDGLAALTTKGDLLGFSTVPVRVAVGSDGNIVVADAASTPGWKWAAPAAAAVDITGMTGATNPKALTDYLATYNAGAAANRKVLVSDAVFSGRNRLFFSDDFMNPGATPVSQYFLFSNVGGGTGTATHPGILNLTGGASPNSGYVRTAVNQILFSGGKWRFTGIINTSAVSDGSNTYSLYAGFGDGTTAEPVDGVYFRYTHSVNSGKFELVTSNNSARTAVDTGITLAASTWYTLEIEVNAAGTSAQAYINGSAAGSANTGTMPTAGGRETGLEIMTVCSLGFNPTLSVDYISGLWEPTTAR